jgi:hypothetical protein
MSFDLRAVLRLDDKFSSPLKKIQRRTEQTQKTMDRLTKSTEQATRSTDKLASGFGRVGSASSGLNGIGRTFVGIGAAIAGATAASKLFNSTIGEAAKNEMATVTIGAMFNDPEKSARYIKAMERMALNSPVLNSADIMNNSGMFVSLTKDEKQLESIWKLVEKLTARNPSEALGGGVFGAAYALSSAFSGDLVSLKDRFNMSTKEIENIKKMKLPQQIKALDKYFAKIGMTERLIEDMGGTTLGLWSQIRETLAVTLRDMGQPALKRIREFLGLANNQLKSGKLEDFAKFGARMLDKIAEGFISAAKGVGKWIDSIRNDPEWQKQTTLSGKVNFILADIYDAFNKWYSGGGSDKIEKMAKDLTGFIASAINANSTKFADVGLKIGAQIGDGIRKGLAKRIGGVIEYDPDKKYNPSDNLLNPADFLPKDGKSHSAGLSRVPYNGYQATLHKNERVLTAEEAQSYRKNGGKTGGNTFNFTVNYSGSGSVKQDAEQLMREMAKIIRSERSMMGGLLLE